MKKLLLKATTLGLALGLTIFPINSNALLPHFKAQAEGQLGRALTQNEVGELDRFINDNGGSFQRGMNAFRDQLQAASNAAAAAAQAVRDAGLAQERRFVAKKFAAAHEERARLASDLEESRRQRADLDRRARQTAAAMTAAHADQDTVAHGLTRDLDDARAQLHDLNQQLAAGQGDKASLQQEILNMQEHIRNLDRDLNTTRADKFVVENERDNAKSEAYRARQHAELATGSLKEANRKVEQGRWGKIKAEVEKRKLLNTKARLIASQLQVDELQTNFRGLFDMKDAVEKSLLQIKRENEELRRKSEAALGLAQDRQAAIATLQQKAYKERACTEAICKGHREELRKKQKESYEARQELLQLKELYDKETSRLALEIAGIREQLDTVLRQKTQLTSDRDKEKRITRVLEGLLREAQSQKENAESEAMRIRVALYEIAQEAAVNHTRNPQEVAQEIVRNIKGLKRTVETLSQEADALRKESTRLLREKGSEDNLVKLQAKCDDLITKNEDAQVKLKANRETAERLKRENKELNTRVVELEESQQEIDKEIRLLKRENEDLQGIVVFIAYKLEIDRVGYVTMVQAGELILRKMDTFQNEFNEMRLKLRENEKKLEQTEGQLKETLLSIEALQQETDGRSSIWERSMDEKTKEILMLQKKMKELVEKNDLDLHELRESQKKITTEAEKEKRELFYRLRKAEETLRHSDEEGEEITQEGDRNRLEITALKRTIEDLNLKLGETQVENREAINREVAVSVQQLERAINIIHAYEKKMGLYLDQETNLNKQTPEAGDVIKHLGELKTLLDGAIRSLHEKYSWDKVPQSSRNPGTEERYSSPTRRPRGAAAADLPRSPLGSPRSW